MEKFKSSQLLKIDEIQSSLLFNIFSTLHKKSPPQDFIIKDFATKYELLYNFLHSFPWRFILLSYFNGKEL